MDKVYIQTYSIREEMDRDFVGSIERLAKIGYAGVELASQYGGFDAAGLKRLLDDNGLDCISAHIGFEQTEEYIDYIARLGARYIICPGTRLSDYDSVMRAADELNRLGQECKKAGLKYGYHNHTAEFRTCEGRYMEDILIENTDPETVVFQLDVGWCTTAGVNAVDYINKYAGRFEMVHAKEAGKVVGTDDAVDYSKVKIGSDGKPVFTPEMIAAMEERERMNVPTGKGIIDWSLVKQTADAQGTKAYVVEREWDYAGDIMRCVQEDWEYLRRI